MTTTTDNRRGWQNAPHRRGEPVPSVAPPSGHVRFYSWTAAHRASPTRRATNRLRMAVRWLAS